jgi:hypothetical protein
VTGCPVPGIEEVPEDSREAVLRWKLGHHMFHLHLATMTTLLGEARTALDESRWPALCERLDELRVLYDAATATMHYASDFSRDLYERLIRPSMAPPYVSPGFSGVLNLEHEQMARRLRDLRHRFKELQRQGAVPDEAREAATRLWRAESRNRRNHILVCTRFVPDGQSLLAEFFSEQEHAEATRTY